MGTRNFNGEGSFKMVSREGDPEKWTGRKQFGYKPNGKPNIKAVYGNSEREVRKKMREFERDYEPSDSNSYCKQIFKDYLLSWFELYKKPNLKTRTYDTMESTIESRFLAYDISKYQMGQLTSDYIQTYINQLATGKRIDKDGKRTLPPYSHESIKKIYNLISNCLTFASEHGHISINPMIGTSIPKESSLETKTKSIGFFNEEDMIKIYKECMKQFGNGKYVYSNNGLAIALLLWTGLRVGEALGLTYNDIDLDNKTLTVNKNLSRIMNRGKNDKNKYSYIITTPKSEKSIRTVHLSKQAVRILEELKRVNKPSSDDEFILVTKSGEHIIDRNLRRTLTTIQETVKTKIQNSGLHTLRHSYASFLIMHNVDVAIVSKLLGHSKTSTTYNVYVHIIESQKANAIDIFDDIEE